MKKAFYVASSGRPGPVLVDISKDITAHLSNLNTLRRTTAFNTIL